AHRVAPGRGDRGDRRELAGSLPHRAGRGARPRGARVVRRGDRGVPPHRRLRIVVFEQAVTFEYRRIGVASRVMDDAQLAPILDVSWAQALDAAADRHGDRVAFHFEGPGWHQALTFSDWRRLSGLAAAGLAALGVRAGDRVAVLAPGGAVWPILQTACSHLG